MDIRTLPYLHVDLDWEAYYERFKQAHGEPVKYKQILLFPDGWTYAMNVAGPEWPPPESEQELHHLQRVYWLIRRKVVKEELDYLIDLTQQLEQAQSSKSVPLQQTIIRRGEDDKPESAVIDVDIASIRSGRLAWLQGDLKDCDDKLSELGYGSNERAIQRSS